MYSKSYVNLSKDSEMLNSKFPDKIPYDNEIIKQNYLTFKYPEKLDKKNIFGHQ